MNKLVTKHYFKPPISYIAPDISFSCPTSFKKWRFKSYTGAAIYEKTECSSFEFAVGVAEAHNENNIPMRFAT